MESPIHDHVSRRQFVGRSSMGIGGVALASLLSNTARADSGQRTARLPAAESQSQTDHLADSGRCSISAGVV